MTHPTLDEIKTELARGGIVEAPISADGLHVAGCCDLVTGIVAVNPLPELADTIIHELTHRMHPRWGEKRVERETKWLMRRMGDADVAAVVRLYRRKAHKRRAAIKLCAA